MNERWYGVGRYFMQWLGPARGVPVELRELLVEWERSWILLERDKASDER